MKRNNTHANVLPSALCECFSTSQANAKYQVVHSKTFALAGRFAFKQLYSEMIFFSSRNRAQFLQTVRYT